jgi:GNAT superfamily N-acetyltransferase
MTTTTSPALRPATIADVEDLTTIWHDGWRDGHLGHVPDTVTPHRRPADFRRRVPGQLAHTTVATVDERVVGFVTVRDDEVEQLYVAADARGTGTAAALLRHGERAVAARHRRAWLAVAPGNARARRFYEREGWSDAGPVGYAAATAGGGTVDVPCRRYDKHLAAS